MSSPSPAVRRQQRSGSQPSAARAFHGFPNSSAPWRRIASNRSGSIATYWRVLISPACVPAHRIAGANRTSQRQRGSGAARAGIEDLAVQVHVELDRAEPDGGSPDEPAERGKPSWARARLPRVADVVVRAVLGLTDPLAVRLRPRGVRGEVVPAARS